MGQDGTGLLDKLFDRRVLRRWSRAARLANAADHHLLRQQRTKARALKNQLDRLIRVADDRLTLPVSGSTSFPTPPNADWTWRPDTWRLPLSTPGITLVESNVKLGDELTIFHDCAKTELTLRQVRNTREADLAPFGMRLDVFSFDGSFLSFVVDLPIEAVTGLSRKHLIRLSTIVECEKPLEIFARLNVQHGPNTEQIVRELPLHEQDVMVEFDLAYTDLNEKRVEKAWVDLIFEGPEMNQVVLRDVTFARRPRAAF